LKAAGFTSSPGDDIYDPLRPQRDALERPERITGRQQARGRGDEGIHGGRIVLGAFGARRRGKVPCELNAMPAAISAIIIVAVMPMTRRVRRSATDESKA
jgi:hypothetical protein